jgi:hypothetical protein
MPSRIAQDETGRVNPLARTESALYPIARLNESAHFPTPDPQFATRSVTHQPFLLPERILRQVRSNRRKPERSPARKAKSLRAFRQCALAFAIQSPGREYLLKPQPPTKLP